MRRWLARLASLAGMEGHPLFIVAASVAERLVLGAMAASLAFWLAVAPLSPYPGQITMDLGDPPAYLCAARALASGSPDPGYFSAEYPGGTLGYPRRHFVPVAVVAVLGTLSRGAGWGHSLTAYCGVAALLLFGVLAEIAAGGAVERARSRALLASGFLVLPAHFVLAGLGCVTFLGALGFATCVALFVGREGGLGRRFLLATFPVAFMALVRPEAALLVVVLGVIVVVRVIVWLWARRPQVAAPTSVVALGLVVVVVWWKVPEMVRAVGGRAPSLSFLHLAYDERAGRFRALHEPPWELNRGYCRQNLNPGAPKTEPCNPRVGEEIRAHPVAFLAWLLGRFGQTALYFVRAVSVAQWEFRPLAGVPAVALVVALMLLAMLARGAAPFVVAAALVVVALPAANRMAHVRHLLLVSPVVLALGVRAVWTRWGDRLAALAGRRWFMVVAGAGLSLLAFLDCRSIIRIRTYWPNRCYEHLLADIERVAAPGDLVAATYPQLVAHATGRRCVGGTWLTENLSGLVAMWRPEVVVVDDFNEVARNYQKLMETGGHLAGYEPVVHNRRERYLVFRRKD